MEIQTSSSKGNYFYGLMAFELPGSNYDITSAQLRLTTERVKGKANMNVYAYGNDFAENTIYATEENYVTAATEKAALDTFTVNYGVKGKALGSDAIDSAYADITKWQTTVDLTNYANSLGSEYMNIMLGKPDDETNSTKFFTKEQGDLTVKLSNGTTTTASASDLIPQLTLVYKKASYNLTVGDAGAATLVLPYEATIPSGVKAYTLSYTSGSEITATEVSTTIPANTPVVLENTTEENFTKDFFGKSTATENTYTVGLLTGVYNNSADNPYTIPASTEETVNYVLQTQPAGQAFYIVKNDYSMKTPNRAYLSVPSTSGTEGAVKAIFFPGQGDATGINAVSTLLGGDVEGIYTVGGAKVNSLQKGVNIIRTADGKTTKVLVK